MTYLAIIPARCGSKGMPGKNIRDIAGKPLIAWSIKAALGIEGVTVVVSTDSEEIAGVAKAHGAEVPFLCPAALATDTMATEPVLLHALDHYEAKGQRFDAIILLQPTWPFRRPGAVKAAIAAFEREGAGKCRFVAKRFDSKADAEKWVRGLETQVDRFGDVPDTKILETTTFDAWSATSARSRLPNVVPSRRIKRSVCFDATTFLTGR